MSTKFNFRLKDWARELMTPVRRKERFTFSQLIHIALHHLFTDEETKEVKTIRRFYAGYKESVSVTPEPNLIKKKGRPGLTPDGSNAVSSPR